MSTIIGIDHGNGLIKTASAQFNTGVAEYSEAPPIETPYLVRLGKKYYVCDSGRGALRKDKTKDDTYWHLTLAGIGVELKKRKIASPSNRPESIIIAAGLPLTYPKDDRIALRKYLMKGEVDFWFAGRHHKIHIKDVLVYPQGYSAIMSQIKDFAAQPVIHIVDIGSWTVDIITINKGVPNMDRARSIENGVIRCMDEISEQVRRNTKRSITQEQIEAVLWPKRGVNLMMPESVKTEIKKQTQKYVADLINKLTESGFDTFSVPAVFIGGGAHLIKHYYKQNNLYCPVYVDDIKSNARGYEIMASASLKKKNK